MAVCEKHRQLEQRIGELESERDRRDLLVAADALESAVEETRAAFTEGGAKWLCPVYDLQQVANRLRREAEDST